MMTALDDSLRIVDDSSRMVDDSLGMDVVSELSNSNEQTFGGPHENGSLVGRDPLEWRRPS